MEFLNDATGKMSKSKGEFLTLSLLEKKGYKPLEYRYFCLGSHYRKQLVFTYDALEIAKTSYNKLINKIKTIKKDNSKLNNEVIKEYQNKFKETLENDLNTSSALTLLYDVIKDENLNNNSKLYLIEDFDKVLSLNLISEETEIDEETKKYIEEMILKRKEAKINKDFELADKIRNELLEKGIAIKDTREGTIYEII